MAAIQVKPGQLYKGLKMFREFRSLFADDDNQKITIIYREWLESPSGDKVDFVEDKRYYVENVPEELGEDGSVVNPTYYGYNIWDNKEIIEDYIGLRLGRDLIKGSINAKLASLPFDVKYGYISKQNE